MSETRKAERRVVLGYPYDAALMWLLSREGGRHRIGHPYYRALFGSVSPKLASRVSSLAVLYDRIIIAPADIGLPDYQSYSSGSAYYNPLIGLYHNWDDYGPIQARIKAATERDLADDALVALLGPSGRDGRGLLLERLNVQLELSRQYGAPVLAGARIADVMNVKLARDRAPRFQPQLDSDAKLDLTVRTFRGTGLDFGAVLYDDLVKLRQDHLVRSYADGFHGALEQALTEADPNRAFRELIRDSMQRDQFREKVSRLFSWGAVVTTITGFISAVWPPSALAAGGIAQLGRASSVVGAGFTVGEAAWANAAQTTWYLLGRRMHEVLLQDP